MHKNSSTAYNFLRVEILLEKNQLIPQRQRDNSESIVIEETFSRIIEATTYPTSKGTISGQWHMLLIVFFFSLKLNN